VEEGEFKLAQLCGLNIIVNADDLDEVSEFYQRRGHFEQLMSLMESGLVSRKVKFDLICAGAVGGIRFGFSSLFSLQSSSASARRVIPQHIKQGRPL
jgi:hypothetical protein